MSGRRFDVFLVRHGVTDWNEEGRLMGRTDVPLNARGREQAASLAVALKDLPIHKLLVSPQRRAQETARAIGAETGLPPTSEPLLAEVWLGRWEGKRFDELIDDPDLDPYLRDADYRCDAVEASRDVRERMMRVVERLTENAVLVSHGDPLRLVLTSLLGLPLADYRRVHIGTGSVSIVRIAPRGGQLLALNWQAGGLRAALPDRPGI